jgi:hypothetical protein
MADHDYSNLPKKGSRTHQSWSCMLTRCKNPNHMQYADYGGRGITVCERWQTFANMGERPEGMTLDRINGDGGYEPGNCKWSNKFEQNQKRRGNVYVSYIGKTQTLKQWSRELGINYKTLHSRSLRVGPDLAIRMAYTPGYRRNAVGRFI